RRPPDAINEGVRGIARHPEPLPARASLWQQPFVQNVLPFLTSLSFHAAVLILGLLTFHSVRILMRPAREEVDRGPLNVDTALVTSNATFLGEARFRGDLGDERVQPLEDRYNDPTATGWNK